MINNLFNDFNTMKDLILCKGNTISFKTQVLYWFSPIHTCKICIGIAGHQPSAWRKINNHLLCFVSLHNLTKKDVCRLQQMNNGQCARNKMERCESTLVDCVRLLHVIYSRLLVFTVLFPTDRLD